MKGNLQMLGAFMTFYVKSVNIYKVHTPFCFELLNEMYDDSKNYYAYDEIEHLRKTHLQNDIPFEQVDLGAGSRQAELQARSRKVSLASITKSAAISAVQGRQLFRLCHKLRPTNILELGSSVGFASLYMSAALPNAQIVTVEGDPKIAQTAKHNFDQFRRKNIQLINANFDEVLYEILVKMKRVDLALIDGNHTKEATLRYFHEILEFCDDQSVLIFDDINWSTGMQEAWQEIKQHPSVTASISNFYKGFIFFRKAFKEPVHINFVPKSWKPWQMGFFN